MTVCLAVLQHKLETGLGRFADLLDEYEGDHELMPTDARATGVPGAGFESG